jgi:hypothetical protein
MQSLLMLLESEFLDEVEEYCVKEDYESDKGPAIVLSFVNYSHEEQSLQEESQEQADQQNVHELLDRHFESF